MSPDEPIASVEFISFFFPPSFLFLNDAREYAYDLKKKKEARHTVKQSLVNV